MSAVRRSHSTASNGDTLPFVNRRSNSNPVARLVTYCVSVCPFNAVLVSAISASAPAALPPSCSPGSRAGGQLLFYSQPQGPGTLLLTEYLSPKISGLRSVSGNRLQWRTAQESNLA